METKSLAQTNSVHNYFNAFHRLISPVVLSLTVIVSRSRIYANLLTSVNGLNKKNQHFLRRCTACFSLYPA